MSEQQSSGCSACDQLGQTPTPEHLAGVARFEARQQAATKVESLEAENARLRERVAALEGALREAERKTARPVGDWKPDGGYPVRCGVCPAVSPPGVQVHLDWCPFAALAGQEQAGGAG